MLLVDDQIQKVLAQLPKEQKKEVLEFIKELSKQHKPVEERKVMQHGCLTGNIWMSDDFDEPLEDFEEYM